MLEEFEYRGEWWLPNNPDKKVFGTLKFTPTDGTVLDLISSFVDSPFDKESSEHHLILGRLSTEEHITLHKCFLHKSSVSLAGFGSCQFYVEKIFIGFHFWDESDLKFESISINYSYLNQWSFINLPKIEFAQEQVAINYKRLETTQPVKINDDWQLSIVVSTYHQYDTLQHININQQTYIVIEPNEKKTFEEFQPVIKHIQNFLSLATKELVYPLVINAAKIKTAPIPQEDRTIGVSIIYQLSITPIVIKKLMPYHMLFTLSRISSNFQEYIQNWFKRRDILEPIYELYFGTLYNENMYPQQAFLNLVQALEAYHRKNEKMTKYDLPEQDHQKRLDEIISNVPQEYIEWLKVKLSYSNEINLRQRLKEILEICSEVLSDFTSEANLFNNKRKKKDFISKAVSIRNYLTHYDNHGNDAVKEQASDVKTLIWLSEKVRIVMEICFLIELGFECEQIKDIFRSRTDRKIIELILCN
ncbi:MAG TPA: HEPN domain-containing protein [Oculatellaceae cyanobacterium]|jgi:hypothetical protein